MFSFFTRGRRHAVYSSGRRMRRASLCAGLVALAMATFAPRAGHADGAPVPPSPLLLPQKLSLDDALGIFRTRGLDLLIADAAVYGAEGDLKIAGATPNPAINGAVGRVFNYDPTDYSGTQNGSPPGNTCLGCSKYPWAVGVSDNAALADTLTGLRGLRLKVARPALEATKLNRLDAQRVLEFQVKQAYVTVAESRAAADFAREVADASARVLELNKLRYPKVIDEGALSRIETAKLEADQQYDTALANLRLSQLGLAYLLGVRSKVPDYAVDPDLMDHSSLPPKLADATEDGLVKYALEHRPDLGAQSLLKERAEAEIELAKRQRIPQFVLSVQYSQTGTGQSAIQPPTLMFGITVPIPLFYQFTGELQKGQADLSTSSLQQTKLQAQVLSDVGSAYTAYVTARKLVERMETVLLASAKRAADITKIQFDAGSTTLMDYLDAQRTYIATKVEYLQDLQSYWTAVYQLEQAVGTELRK